LESLRYNYRRGPKDPYTLEVSNMMTRRILTVLVTLLLMFSLPMTFPGLNTAEETDDAPSEGPAVVGDDGASSRRKEFPNTDTWEWLNPVPAYGKFNDVQWQPESDIAVIVGHNGLILEREGSTWSIIQSNTIYNLWHIEFKPDGSYALITGNAGTVIKYIPGEAQHLDPGTNIRLQGSGWKDDGSYALICGWEGLLLKYEKNKFTRIETGVTERLYNVTFDTDNGWLISGENGLLLTYDEPTGNITQIPTGIDDLLFSNSWYNDMALIVGGNGTILKYEGGSVMKVSNSITSKDLYGVEWDHINGYALIGGKDGVALQYSSGTLDDISPGTTQWLIGISFLNQGNDALVVGTKGIVYNYVHGGGWTQMSSKPFEGDFKDVQWDPDGNYALIVGSGGVVIKYNDSVGLTSLASYTTKTLRAISWAPNGSYALIVGDGGTVLKYNGTNFTALDTGFIDLNLLAVDWRSDGQYALIVGSYGKILKWDGTGFTTAIPEDQAKNFLFGIAFHPSNTYSIIAGASGMAYKCEEDGAPKYQPSGIKCLRIATGVFSTMRDVEFRDDGEYAILVGLSGIVLKYQNNEFEIVDHDVSTYSFADVEWKTDSLYPIIVGSQGIFMKYSGYGAVQMPCPAIKCPGRRGQEPDNDV